LGREEFLKKVWEVKELHHGHIVNQLNKIGASLDWRRERFTMDEGLSKAVRENFVKLYEDGLIYRDTRMINWCSRCFTALSDLEVVPRDKKGHLWKIKYKVSSEAGEELTIATTRPETLLGDSAVAVHPDDDRYKHLIGKKVNLPLTSRQIPIIADEYVDTEFGTGALKITPAHDFNDYEIGKKHGLEIIDIFTRDGKIAEGLGPYSGLEISKAREKVVEDLENQDLLVEIEDYQNKVGECDRCATVAEPTVSLQWFVKTEPLAKPAIEAVENGDIKLIPEHFEKTYFGWMRNIRDWCISRQLWWGHQIPAWYCEKDHVVVSRETPEKCPECGSFELKQDEDVLDTWFSSGLWPFGTLGWPEKTKSLEKFYPGAVLETGKDIIFFWVARMIMFGLYHMKEIPFKDVFFHAMVLDAAGKKMSKTRGNVIDPLGVIDEVGADALRFTLASLSGQGQSIRLSKDRIDGYKNFINKLWNASRFTLSNIEEFGKDIDFSEPVENWASSTSDIDQWIIGEFQNTSREVQDGLEKYRFMEVTHTIYRFVWDTFCSAYLEFSKENIYGSDENAKKGSLLTLNYVLNGILKLLHPFIPFVSEEIYQKLPHRGAKSISIDEFPVFNENLAFEEVTQSVHTMKSVIDEIRSFRGEHGISPKTKIPEIAIHSEDKSSFAMLDPHIDRIKALAGVDKFELVGCAPTESDESGKMKLSTGSITLLIPPAGLVDLSKEVARLDKQITKIEKDLGKLTKKLSNPKFIENADPDVVEKVKAEEKEFQEALANLQSAKDRLGS
jgi:valyl-tRNA synthetase